MVFTYCRAPTYTAPGSRAAIQERQAPGPRTSPQVPHGEGAALALRLVPALTTDSNRWTSPLPQPGQAGCSAPNTSSSN